MTQSPPPPPPKPAPAPSHVTTDHGVELLIPINRTGWSIAAGYLGLFSLLPFIGILAIIISGIAFPSIFQISITFEMPFGFPPVLVQFAEWVTSIVSLDLGQVGSPDCAVSDEGEPILDVLSLFYKFLATVRNLGHTLSLSRSKAKG